MCVSLCVYIYIHIITYRQNTNMEAPKILVCMVLLCLPSLCSSDNVLQVRPSSSSTVDERTADGCGVPAAVEVVAAALAGEIGAAMAVASVVALTATAAAAVEVVKMLSTHGILMAMELILLMEDFPPFLVHY